MSHSIIPPSAAGIWGKPGGCTAWVGMNQLYPETEQSEAAAIGEASHEIAEGLIRLLQMGLDIGNASNYIGQTAANGVVFDNDMYDGALLYANDVYKFMCSTVLFDRVKVEYPIKAPNIHEKSFGTCDACLHDIEKGHIYIWDYKFGFNVVEPYENWQLINYVSGLLHELGINGIADQHLTVHMRIVQPRAFHPDGPIRKWVVKASDLRPYFNQLEANAEKALSDDAEANTGVHCKYCPGRHACTAALKAGNQLFEAASSPLPVELSDHALGVQLSLVRRALEQLKCLESGYETQVSSKIRAGQSVPGWTIQDTFGRLKWDKPFHEVISMGSMMNKDLKKDELITPNQAMKLGIDGKVIMAYSSKSRSGVKIVESNVNQAKRIFSK